MSVSLQPSGWFSFLPASLSAPAFSRLRVLVFVAALLPLLRLGYLALVDGGAGLGANPVEFMIRSLGTWTLVFLCITLAITPLRLFTGWVWLARLRRMLGLFCFFYVCLHFSAYLWLDQWFDWGAIWKDIVKRPYITVGFAAFVLLIPLAVTSTNAMVKRLGAKNWQRLHKLIYPIALLAITHYWWHKAGKNDFSEVGIYAAVVAVLLGARLLRWMIKRAQARSAAASG